jgi:N-acetylglutamate synthase-like GNAT family acetyltransferase
LPTSPWSRRDGLFTQLFERFLARDWSLPVNHLFVENVSSARFAAWLERRGFSACPYGDALQPTLFFERIA